MVEQRVLDLAGGVNFRELGGYPTVNNHTIKWHKLIRSANLATLADSDLLYLKGYGVATDIDLRSDEEIKQQPDRIPDGVTYSVDSVFPSDQTDASKSESQLTQEFSANPHQGYQHMIEVYQDMVTTKQAQGAYRDLFDNLLANDQSNQSILFHCTAGKDRTGMGAIFTLSALDVDPTVIKDDYLLTNQVAGDHIQHNLNEIKQKGASQTLYDNIAALLTVSADYYDAAMKVINTQYGGMADYLHDVLGLTTAQKQTLQKIYLD
ncbi:tyrosine-protein phosphatase [Levilactobacillus bambusae]|uniref:Protein-tyrosine-phosphatase n=1 Tax=Levilactobacillus bambusae TaxID=2024736 RepID=A0A2V1N0C7_9LACO|nr:tyrosine-protein phosphatase [Levilactobacillus bambusae]PWF99799.1 protein-tyrosine-phosphatase [Levilactobacillus bambusae]